MTIKSQLNVYANGISSSGTLGAPIDATAQSFIFVHGLGSSQNFYYALLPALLPLGNCFLFNTDGSNPDVIIHDITKDIISILDHHQVAKTIIVGHSMGGIVANTLTANYPTRVTAQVLIGPVHPTPVLADIFTKRIDIINESGSLINLINSVPLAATGSKATSTHHAFIRQLISSHTPQAYIAMCNVIAKSQAPDYKSIEQKTLIILGEDDKTAPYKGCVEFIDQGLGNSEVVVLNGVGHWHCIEAADEVAREIVKFVNTL